MDKSMAEEKAFLRAHYQTVSSGISLRNRLIMGEEIFHNLVLMKSFRESTLILSYVSIKGEADTRRMIDYALKSGKQVAVPRCRARGEMDFFRIKSLSDLREGRFGLLEPEPDALGRVFVHDVGLCVVPALAFDIFGSRIGHGGGYYDRFLADFSGTAIGLCYSPLLLNTPIPCEPHDRKVDFIVTERSSMKAKNPCKL